MKTVKRYLVEWTVKHSCAPDRFCHNMSKEFATKGDAEQFISKLKHTYEPPEDYYDKLSVEEPKEIYRLDESCDYNGIFIECLNALRELYESLADSDDVERDYKQSCIFAAEEKLMTVANVVLDCFD